MTACKAKGGHTGHSFDTGKGLSYMQARYYDPVIGRFYSNDLVGTLEHLCGTRAMHGFSRYAYANNNPFKFIDPNGESNILALTPTGNHDSIIETGKVLDKFGKNYSDMRDANTIGADKYCHCKANCEAAISSDLGEELSEVISDTREWTDQNIKGDSEESSAADQEANKQGRDAGSEMRKQQQPQACPVACGDLKLEALDEKY
ncbi:hypothetical protein OE749_13785 [Aestuariibacter sp. AA17]|uniref:RHS repeat-associated core domain-containing protein n=1 Tax=Fluctibacter corallii TaxID=2984329 RepID=A0ABT3AAR3_9ALTE|nr:RHS repeat-associated core domain-containing protein [Aestuariibacter sp. AA17]MCV2885764.1 hypothetical protein [Aestuariibacter sp. AA17]